jgi:hypothetical protein
MNPFWLLMVFVSLAGFLGGLGGAAWRGQDAAGHWRRGGWRWLALAAGSLCVLMAALHLTGVERLGVYYPNFDGH